MVQQEVQPGGRRTPLQALRGSVQEEPHEARRQVADQERHASWIYEEEVLKSSGKLSVTFLLF